MKNQNIDQFVKQYILDSIDLEVYEESASSAQEAARKVIEFIMQEADFPYNRQKLQSDQAIIADHLMGLPSYINIEYRNHAILELAVKWGSLPVNASEKEEQKILDNWFMFIAAKLQQIARGYRVKGLTWEAVEIA